MSHIHKVAVLSLLLVASSQGMAKTRSTTGFNAFHVQDPTIAPNSYACLTEDNGAVVNNCTGAVNLVFDLPIDSTGTKTVTVTDYWNAPSPFTNFDCGIFDQAGLSSSSNNFVYVGFTTAKQTVQGNVTVTNATNDGITIRNTIALLCVDVPPGEGVANINWTY